MPLDRQAKRFLDMLAASGGAEGGYASVKQRRQALNDLSSWTSGEAPAVAEVRDVQIPGPAAPILVRVYTPIDAGAGPSGGMVYFHGGGWVAGSLETHDGVCRRLANASGCRVLAVDYRLAPEHPFPAAVDDAVAAVGAIVAGAAAFDLDARRIGVAGDSAGAGLAAAVAQMARASGPSIAFQLLICPILDLASETPSRVELAEGHFLNRATLERDLELYGPANLGDPRVSPLRRADLSGLAPALIHTAEFDPFRDEGRAYARRLTDAGVAVSLVDHPGMIHYFYAMPRIIGRAEAALAMMGAEISSMLDRRGS